MRLSLTQKLGWEWIFTEKILHCPERYGSFPPATATYDPFVYRLGLQVFILARRVRLPYGSPFSAKASARAGAFWFRESSPFHEIPATNPVTALEKADAIRARKGGRPIAAVTAYDYPTARLLDESGVDVLLVGDSLGMVVLGFPDTTMVTLADMLHHVSAVARAKPEALVVGDLPIHTYDTAQQALDTARQLVAAGAEAVKLEGGVRQADKVRAIVAAGIPVMGHLGMLPQRVIEEGGYRKKGKTPEQADALRAGAEALVEAGVFSIVFESVIPKTASSLAAALPVPIIGIGCGQHTCDGEIAVVTDLLGSYPWFVPPFARPGADVANITRTAIARYVADVQGPA